jgi:predicted ATP-dependent serine protease
MARIYTGRRPSIALRPAKAGKTTFAYHLCRAIAKGEQFLGFPTEQSPVLILALEEHRQDVAARLRKLNMLGNKILLHTAPLKASNRELSAIKQFIQESKVGLIVVDTLARFWTVGDENSASDVGAQMAGLLDLCRTTNTALLLLHHLRKSNGNSGDDIRGSGDLFANADVALTFKRHGSGCQRTLEAFSRYNETEKQLSIFLEGDTYTGAARASDVHHQKSEDILLKAIRSGALDVTAMSIATGLPSGTIRDRLPSMVQRGEIIESGKGIKGSPHIYRVPSLHSDAQDDEDLRI